TASRFPLAASAPQVPWLASGARQSPEVTFLRSQRLLLLAHARLLEMLALAQLGEDPRLLARLFEAANRRLDRLVVFDSNTRHRISFSLSYYARRPRRYPCRTTNDRARRNPVTTIRMNRRSQGWAWIAAGPRTKSEICPFRHPGES